MNDDNLKYFQPFDFTVNTTRRCQSWRYMMPCSNDCLRVMKKNMLKATTKIIDGAMIVIQVQQQTPEVNVYSSDEERKFLQMKLCNY